MIEEKLTDSEISKTANAEALITDFPKNTPDLVLRIKAILKEKNFLAYHLEEELMHFLKKELFLLPEGTFDGTTVSLASTKHETDSGTYPYLNIRIENDQIIITYEKSLHAEFDDLVFDHCSLVDKNKNNQISLKMFEREGTISLDQTLKNRAFGDSLFLVLSELKRIIERKDTENPVLGLIDGIRNKVAAGIPIKGDDIYQIAVELPSDDERKTLITLLQQLDIRKDNEK